jgi:hypothetical protein
MVTVFQQSISRWTAHDAGRMHPFSLAVANVSAPKTHIVNYSINSEDWRCFYNS